ncbi:hypothetical protein HNR74_003096 [Flammeovirga kamogawensis]|nr:hypothetical protein [Flammeovirga kamogawensis]
MSFKATLSRKRIANQYSLNHLTKNTLTFTYQFNTIYLKNNATTKCCNLYNSINN